MARNHLFISIALVLVVGCDDGASGGDGGDVEPGMDGGHMVLPDGRVAPRDGGGEDGGGGCEPTWEICGDRVDQNCDGRDTSCGDTDMDNIPACRPGEAPPDCDCDDARADVYPPFGGGVPGAAEACDGIDNDCDGRVDEAAQCCAACMALDDPSRGDVCTEAGACDCTTEPGEGPCAAGQTCCASGCVDILSDEANCGFCGVTCMQSTDTCTAGSCTCGTMASGCAAGVECVAGACAS